MNEVWRWLHRLRMVWAVLAAFALGSLLILAAGKNPMAAYQALFKGAFFDYHGLANTLVKMCPMLLAGLAEVFPLAKRRTATEDDVFSLRGGDARTQRTGEAEKRKQ